jgi:hypothetical protein
MYSLLRFKVQSYQLLWEGSENNNPFRRLGLVWDRQWQSHSSHDAHKDPKVFLQASSFYNLQKLALTPFNQTTALDPTVCLVPKILPSCEQTLW